MIPELEARLDAAGALSLRERPTGLFPATQGSSNATGYDSVWVRDNVHIAHMLFEAGEVDRAARCAGALLQWAGHQHHRFEAAITLGQAPADPMERPHVRFDGRTMAERPEPWPHAQNDAWGYLLWLVARLLSAHRLTIEDSGINTIALIVRYLGGIQYWADADSGHWEEAPKVEASSIGTVVAGLRAVQRLVSEAPAIFGRLERATPPLQHSHLDELIASGEAALAAILPAESRDPKRPRAYDAALLFLIHPLDVVSREMADRILADVLSHLEGEVGVRRYLGDTFWCRDYRRAPAEIRTAPEEGRLAWFQENQWLPTAGGEAQWCLFDPIISIIFGKRYAEGGRRRDLDRQVRYLNRALAQLEQAEALTGRLRCPELFFLEDGRWVPNDIDGLCWTAANLRLAFKQMRKSIAKQRG